jgi:bacteriocin-like protein
MTNNPDEAKGSRGDHLTATTPDGKIELTEEELKRVSGGTLTLNFAKITFTPSPHDAKAPVRGS